MKNFATVPLGWRATEMKFHKWRIAQMSYLLVLFLASAYVEHCKMCKV